MLSFKSSACSMVLITLVCFGLATKAASQQILSGVESNSFDDALQIHIRDAQGSSQAGQLVSTTFGGTDSRAVTRYGVNKIYSKAMPEYNQTATSNWIDVFTVAGAPGATVNINFTFSIDGNINIVDDPDGIDAIAYTNYSVYAVKGGNWELKPTFGGDVYSLLSLQNTSPNASNSFERFDPNYFNTGIEKFNNNGGISGSLIKKLSYDKAENTFTTITVDAVSGNSIESTTIWSETGQLTTRVNLNTGQSFVNSFVPHNDQNMGFATWINLQDDYSILDSDRMCSNVFNSCTTGQYPGSNLTLSFDALAGSSFTLLSSLHSFDLFDGSSVDFFSTAKVTGVSVTAGGSLTSLSGALTEISEGQYGYAAALNVVPEPATWATLIAGFGLIGGSMRRRRKVAVLEADSRRC